MRTLFTFSRLRHSRGSVPPWLILFLVAAAAATPFLMARGKGSDLVKWRNDFDAAKAEAKSTGRPIFIDFTADWCPPCKAMKREVFAKENVAGTLNEKCIPVKIDLTDRASPGGVVARQYNVSAIPTLILADAEGKVLRTHVGGIGPDLFLQWLAETK